MDTKKILRMAIFMTLISTLAACSQAGVDVKDPLDGTSWLLTAYRRTTPIAGTQVTATFENGQIRGSGGCNTYSGAYSTNGDQLLVDQLAWTLMACLDPEGAMEQEIVIMGFLSNADRFLLDGEQLQILRTDGEALTFVRQ